MASFKVLETQFQDVIKSRKSIDERAKHKREYDIRVNERQIQTTEGKVDTGKAMDASLVNTESIGIRWVPTGNIFTSSTTKVDSKPENGLNDDITNKYECEQTLDVSAGTLNIHAGTSLNPLKEGLEVWSELGIRPHNEQSRVQVVPKVVPQADKTAISTTRVGNTISPST
ncbi:hypothetical protein Tco_0374123 [Tanacetum coccineum]